MKHHETPFSRFVLINKLYKVSIRIKRIVFYLLKKMTLPGFQGQSVYDVLEFFFIEIGRDSLQVRATSISFYFLMALFPSLLVMFTLIPYLPVTGLQESILNGAHSVLPDMGYEFIQHTLENLLNTQNNSLLSIGLIMSLYYSTSGVLGLLDAFNKMYPAFRKRKFINKIFVALKINILLIVLLIVSATLIIAGKWIIPLIFNNISFFSSFSYLFFAVAQWIVTLLCILTGISLIYYYGPATHVKWRFFNPGSIFATVLSILASLCFSYLMENFSQLNKIYGSIGTLIIIMFWFYWNSLILMIGFELNASIAVNRHNKLHR
ncbi:MAG: YihY/virulence factor BrkB family protein [Bacteroidota bacterium]|jgi:membrane protein